MWPIGSYHRVSTGTRAQSLPVGNKPCRLSVRDASASASLSTWISAARPILASSLPLIAEYNALEPDAIHTFDPYTAASLADAIRAALDRDSDAEVQRVARLRERLLPPAILDRHVEAYRELLGASTPARL